MSNDRLLFDAHLDLAWSAISFNRDLTQEIATIRASERHLTDEPCRARNTVSFPELKKSRIKVCLATLLARSGPEQPARTHFKRTDLDFAVPALAHAQAHAQLAYYRLMEREGVMQPIRTATELKNFWSRTVEGEATQPLGYILSMEGADPITQPSQVEYWWQQGLRAVGPAHYGRGQYAYGTGVDGPLSPACYDLLWEFERVGMILDATHLSDISFFQALEKFSGRVLASHHNSRSLVPGDRQLTDEQIKLLAQRQAVIGVALDAWMLYPNWKRGETQSAVVSLSAVADHIDHVCELTGNSAHIAIGSDLDGGFGTEQTPRDLDTIRDLQKLNAILVQRGYSEADLDAIFHGNWLRFFTEALPA